MGKVADKAKKRRARLRAAAEHDDEAGQVHPVKDGSIVKTADDTTEFPGLGKAPVTRRKPSVARSVARRARALELE